MDESIDGMRRATPPEYVGPACAVVVIAAAGMFIAQGMIDEAMLSLVGAGVLLNVGIIDLLAELIVIGRDIRTRLNQSEAKKWQC